MGAWHKLNLSIFKKVLSVGSGKLAQELDKKVELINKLESDVEKYSDEEIKNKFQNLKTKITNDNKFEYEVEACLLYTSPSPRDPKTSRMPSSA